MKTIATIGMVACSIMLAGCATMKGYIADRNRDAADIITLTVGTGLGLKVRASSLHVGLLTAVDEAGLRGGEFYSSMSNHYFMAFSDFEIILLGFEEFYQRDSISGLRGKHYHASGFPIWTYVHADSWQEKLPYYTDIQLVAGLFKHIRIGINPGELLDFILGLTTIDIFNDDLKKRKQKEESNKRLDRDAAETSRAPTEEIQEKKL